jgi:hypothetical protein
VLESRLVAGVVTSDQSSAYGGMREAGELLPTISLIS